MNTLQVVLLLYVIKVNYFLRLDSNEIFSWSLW